MDNLVHFGRNLLYIFKGLQERDHIVEYGISFLFFSILFYSLLNAVKYSKNKYLRNIFYVLSPKSSSNAIQLGGLPLTILFTTIIVFMINFGSFLSKYEYRLCRYAIMTYFAISVYGYVDDKYEIRPIAKLLCQIAIAMVYSLLASPMLFPTHTALALIIATALTIAVINGTNVLDGLDTISFKISVSSLISYIILGTYIQSSSTVSLSTLFITTLTGFYLYNREPSKIHLGEIGSAAIGFTHIFISVIVYYQLVGKMGFSHFNAIALASIPFLIHCSELTISFMRRLLTHKAPFKGDKLHSHYLMVLKYDFSPSTVATIYGVYHLVTILLTFAMAYITTPVIAAGSLVAVHFLANYAVGRKHWKSTHKQKENLIMFVNHLKKKDVTLISNELISDFKIDVISPGDDSKTPKNTRRSGQQK